MQLGRSPESMAAITFVVEENQKKDTGFLKVSLVVCSRTIHPLKTICSQIILASEPLSLSFMEQNPVLGYDEWGYPSERAIIPLWC